MNIKSSVYPAVIIALLGLVGLVLGWLQFTVSIETINPEPSLPDPIHPTSQSSPSKPFSPIPSVPTPISTPTELVKQYTKPTYSPEPVIRTGEGALRITNQTDQPVRVALLARHLGATSEASEPPAHWDFAPGEGSREGLILSLPQGNLNLKKGDILVAFAQDGSRRYWGPYVVGETPVPIWNQQISEWQLVLQP